jgi:hypothetical protein
MSGIELNASLPNLEELAKAFKTLPPTLAAKHMGPPIRKALKPALATLKKSVKKGPTGNLRRSVSSVFRKYAKDGAAVGLVGYKDDKRFAAHQHLYEYGTTERFTKGPVASSWGRKKFTMAKTPGKAGAYTPQPRDDFTFYYKSWKGRPVYTGRAEARNSLADAFNSSLAQMRNILQKEMASQLDNALREFVGKEKQKAKA